MDLRRGISSEQVLEFVRAQLKKFLEDGLTRKEFERARNRIELDCLESLQTAEQRAHSMGFWQVVAEDCRFAETRLHQYQTLTVDTILEMTRSWWSEEALSWVVGKNDNEELS